MRKHAGWRVRLSVWRQKELEKMEVAVTGSEVEGFCGLLRGAVLHNHPYPNPHLLLRKLADAPSSTISHLHPFRNPRNLKPLFLQSRHWNHWNLFNCPFSFRGRDPCWHATPLYSVGGIKRVYKCLGWGLQGGPINLIVLPFALTCSGYTWEWGWCAPSATNPSSILTHSSMSQEEIT